MALSGHRAAESQCPLLGVKRTKTARSWSPPAGDCRFACPFLALLFSRIVNARLSAFAPNSFEIAHRQNDAWRATHETGFTRRHATFQAFGRHLVFNELALEAETVEDRREAGHAEPADWFCAGHLEIIAAWQTHIFVKPLAIDLQFVHARADRFEHSGIGVECRHYARLLVLCQIQPPLRASCRASWPCAISASISLRMAAAMFCSRFMLQRLPRAHHRAPSSQS